MPTRSLSNTEITILEQRGCRAEDWTRVTVDADFALEDSFRDVRFSGDVRLGVYSGDVDMGDGIFLPVGIRNARLHNATVGNNCRIEASTIANADVGDGSIVDAVSSVSCVGETAFGNGFQANVLTEDGARSVPLWRNLTAQLAHLLCHYKGLPVAETLEETIAEDCRSLTASRSRIGAGCRLLRGGKLVNVWIGDGVTLDGVGDLRDCWVEGAYLGEGVSAEGCVFLEAGLVEGGVRLERCLVGQGAVLGQGLYAKHCLFFANASFKLGEAVSVMAGPFTESHHRATLALTCQCSFGTFGSGANSSNHHFKLGPRHGGVLRRGTRCGSGAYLYWPGDVGAFSTVTGRHVGHLETVDFPFSLLVAGASGSVLVPGVHVFGVGVYRDGMKWRKRDRRAGLGRVLDLVNSAAYSPYVMQAIERGLALLYRSEGMEADLRHGGAVIPARRIKPAIRLYEACILFYIGECLLRGAAARGGRANLAGMIRELTADGESYSGGVWRDWGGMLLAGRDAEAFCRAPRVGELERIHALYGERELEWAAWRFRREHGEVTGDGVEAFLDEWRRVVEFRFECLVKDAGKEFGVDLCYGFGVEGDAVESFRRIRGVAADEAVVKAALEEKEYLLKLAGK